jgi:hypothetical protein
MMWDLNLCVNHEQKQLIPFKYLVRPDSPSSPEVSQLFTCFAKLPVEIQLEIFDFCDAATLFQLMHTCASTRIQASKRFWSKHNTWYSCQDITLFDSFIKHPIPLFDLSFASQITQIEISIETLSTAFRTEYVAKEEFVQHDDDDDDDESCEPSCDDNEYQRPVILTYKARVFWEKVQTVFPAAQRVVIIGQPWARNVHFYSDESERNYIDVGLAVQQAPAHLDVLIALESPDSGPQELQTSDKLWRVLRDSDPPAWHLVQDVWTPTRVLPPPRKFTNFPLGALLAMVSERSAMDLERRGLHWLTLESYARYPYMNGLQCPSPPCSLIFPNRSTWAQHLSETTHARTPAEALFKLCSNTPAEERAALVERREWVLKRQQDANAIECRLTEAWSDSTEDIFYKQLKDENIFAPGELVQEKCHWIDRMEDVVDPVVCCFGLYD